ncbi:MAG: LysM domain-containing protein [Pseudomonadota bacterium]
MRLFWFCLALGLVPGFLFPTAALADPAPEFSYTVRPGDSLWEISRLFLEQPSARRLAGLNNITNARRIWPGQVVRVPAERPANVVREYLRALGQGRAADAWTMFCLSTREKYSPADLENALEEMTFSGLRNLSVAEYRPAGTGPPVLRLNARMEEDAAAWGFNLVFEDGQWCILLLDLGQGMARARGETTGDGPPVP